MLQIFFTFINFPLWVSFFFSIILILHWLVANRIWIFYDFFVYVIHFNGSNLQYISLVLLDYNLCFLYSGWSLYRCTLCPYLSVVCQSPCARSVKNFPQLTTLSTSRGNDKRRHEKQIIYTYVCEKMKHSFCFLGCKTTNLTVWVQQMR